MAKEQHQERAKIKPAVVRYLVKLTLLCCLWAVAVSAAAQSGGLASLLTSFKQYRQQALQEKIFLHLDRPFYTAGETMWFKLYQVDATLHRPHHMSKVAYVEVLNEKQQPVLQGKIHVAEGMGKGSFVLPLTLDAGQYVVRAYTNWMKNFSPDFYFEQQVTILNTYKKLDLKSEPEAPAYSLQFFPEGGNLVHGLESKVAFKVTDAKSGKGQAATGEIRNRAGQVVQTFQPANKGIGYFTFTPDRTEKYTAVITIADQQVLTQQLPMVHEQGYVLQVQQTAPQNLNVSIRSTGQQAEQVYLLGHARQMVSVAATGTLVQGKTHFSISTDSLAEGITHFTLFSSKNQPVCERLYFKRPTQKLDIETVVAKDAFSQREQVELQLQTRSEAGNMIPANLSLAVYRLHEGQAAPVADISSYLWLTSELAGEVEDPGYYLHQPEATADAGLDNLMLTHGWSRFKWEEILENEPFSHTYTPEYDGHLIRGRLTHAVSGRAAPGITTFLASPSKYIRLYTSESDSNGEVQFEVKNFLGSKEIVLQTDFRKDSTYHVEVFNSFSEKYAARPLPAFYVPEPWQPALALRHREVEAQQLYFGAYRNLFRAAGADSIAFYGQPDQQYYLDDYTRFKVMEEVMREYVSGVMVRKRRGSFHYLVVNKPYKTYFKNDPLVLLDGVPVFDIDKIMAFDPLAIKRLDVITGTFLQGKNLHEGVVSYATYKGDLAGFPLDTRALLLEYEGLQREREFYAPTYITPEQKQSRLPDFRNLLYWNPEIETKADGKAQVSYFTSDSAGSYVVVVQGITSNGLFGSKTIRFEVKQPL
ncbi:hypothetical protein FVR03_07865 [Pontibacter qinzhouensis]|uniref:Macroglobulin domain-containing protein n=1 Tax=Pontibacter qinzhouensis TaxID=2603253 RepID=A0A5C8KC35_9BACT|nr:hypothetical protein [Pontibacter qinzhouensis]TXK48605.1 hypothetical protein FVR03_07865 [Pontibacter qinzhouensis]